MKTNVARMTGKRLIVPSYMELKASSRFQIEGRRNTIIQDLVLSIAIGCILAAALVGGGFMLLTSFW